ncbi:APC family permease [Patescibacteria group bacterium]|nr:APC family permease [Patescibacteria group bacterium]
MKENILKKIKLIKLNKKSIIFISLFIFLGLFAANPVFAAADWVIEVVGGILGLIVSSIGLILILAIRALVHVAQYSTFLDSGAVTFGWVIVRDLCNMFFVIVLLIIAFGTILNLEKYNYKKWLPKLILMAILINFSKTISGIFIDIAQVVMLTFVNSFSSIGAGSLINVLGITDILQIAKDNADVSLWTVVGAYLLGLAYVVISLIVVVTMIAMLAIRIVMIWIYVVLSPLAYLLSAFPGGQSYASKWWSDFTKNLIVGPVLAFFLWLSFAALTADQLKYSQEEAKVIDDATTKEQEGLAGNDASDPGAMGTKASSPSALIKFVIAIGMLVGGLKIAQEVGGAAGSMAGKGMAAVNKAGKIGLAGAAAVTGARYAKGVYKNYSATRKSAREDRYKEDAIKMAGGIGKVKDSIGKGVTGGLQKAKDITFGRVGAKAKRLEVEAREEVELASTMQQRLDQKNGPILGDEDIYGERQEYNYDASDKKWKDKKGNIVQEDDLQAIVDSTKKSASSKQIKAGELHSKQQNIDKLIKYAALAVGGVAGVVATGGLGGLALAGAGAVGISRGYDKFKNAGKTDLATGSGYRLKEIKKEKDDLKDKDDKNVLAQMDDRTVSSFERAAAALEAMERGLLSSDQAQAKREMIMKEVGGAEDGNFKDKKVGSYFESIAQKKNLSASSDFQNLNSSNEGTRDRAEKNIRDNLEKGNYGLTDLDSKAIEAIGPQIVALMKNKDFGMQFSAIKDQGKKREIVEMLKTQTSVDTSGMKDGSVEKNNAEAAKLNAMKKLNQVKDLETATATVADPVEKQKKKEEILADISFTQLSDIFNGNDKTQQDAIVKAIRNSSRDDKLSIFVTAEKSLNGPSSVAKSLREAIGLKTHTTTTSPPPPTPPL